MSKPILLQDRFDRVWRDTARDRLPEGAVWSMTDYIPGETDAPLGKRGGWAYASQALTTVLAGADDVVGVIYAPFSAAGQLVAVARDTGGPTYRCAQIVSSSSTTDRGATQGPEENLTFYRDKVYITKAAGDAVPETYNGSSNATDLTGSPPNGSRSEVYKDHLCLARTSTQLQRVYFSGAGDPTSWDTTNGYIDTSGEVRGMWALRNALMIFHDGKTERITGSIPPPGTDMTLQPLFDVGLYDARSLAGTDDFVCFANGSGVYLTDGAAVADLTMQGGIKSYWASQFTSVSPTSIAGGFFRGYYIVTAKGASTSFTALCHIESRRWFFITNTACLCFGRKVTVAGEELYGGLAAASRVISLSSLFSPSSTFKADGDGTAVTPTLELPYYQTGTSKATFRNVYVVYDVRDAASDNPVLTVSYITSPESTSYTNVTDYSGSSYPLAETTEMTRVKRRLHFAALGVGFKIAQTNSSSFTRIYRLELEAEEREGSNVTP